MAKDQRPDTLIQAVKGFDEDRKHHDLWIAKVEGWYRAWRGILNETSQANDWHSKQHPPYLLQIIETLCAGVIDPNPRWRVKPRPKLAEQQQIVAAETGARTLQWLLDYQRAQDRLALKQRTHRLQGLIAGLTVWKTYWRLEETGDQTNVDDPCAEVVDVRDFIWHEAARTVPDALRITHRVWAHYDDLLDLQRQGVYENVEQLNETRDFASEHSNREQGLFSADRSKDMVEVLECWVDQGQRVVTVGNRNVLLRERDNPFRHGHYPFVACSPIPDLFRIPGVSTVELVADLQEMLWTLQNQRLDNLEIINNAIIKLRDDVSDPNGFVFAPGEQWLVPDDKAATILEMPTFPAEVSLVAENMIKADIQNIPGASPALQGQSETSQQTATEISLLTNLAQRRLAAEKFQFTLADIEVGRHWIELNQQFLTEPRYIAVVGPGGEQSWQQIHPDTFTDIDYDIVIDQMDESLIRQERLAEAQARFQVAIAAAPVMAAVRQPLNMKAFLEDYLDAADVQDKEKYFSATPQQLPMSQNGAPPASSPAGVSAPQATDINSPSNQFSQSPVAAMQQMLATSGGPVNAGN